MRLLLAGLAGGLMTACLGTVEASEVRLYAGPNCSGQMRILVQSEADLDRTDFGNAAAAVQVISGTWSFFRDDNFQSNNGPPITLGPGVCVTMGQGPAAQMPPALMDSVQLVQGGPGPEAAIVLWDAANLQGRYRVLTINAPDLDLFGYDNRLESFQVLGGSWRIYRDDGFQTQNGPPLVASGTVSDVDQAGFPGGLASSVQLAANDVVPPPPAQEAGLRCLMGQADYGSLCVDCRIEGLLVAEDGRSCICPQGQQQAGTRVVNGVAVPLCQRQLATVSPPAQPDQQQAVCSGALVSVGGGCVPCPQGAVPNAGNTQCQCAAGFQQVGIEGTFGMPVCSPVSGGSQGGGVAMVDYRISGLDAFAAGRRAGFAFTASGSGAPVLPLECNLHTSTFPNHVTLEYWPNITPVPIVAGTCTFRLFAGRILTEGWTFVSLKVVVLPQPGLSCHGYGNMLMRETPGNPRSLAHTVTIDFQPEDPPHVVCVMELAEVTVRGPAGADWRNAFR